MHGTSVGGGGGGGDGNTAGMIKEKAVQVPTHQATLPP